MVPMMKLTVKCPLVLAAKSQKNQETQILLSLVFPTKENQKRRPKTLKLTRAGLLQTLIKFENSSPMQILMILWHLNPPTRRRPPMQPKKSNAQKLHKVLVIKLLLRKLSMILWLASRKLSLNPKQLHKTLKLQILNHHRNTKNLKIHPFAKTSLDPMRPRTHRRPPKQSMILRTKSAP